MPEIGCGMLQKTYQIGAITWTKQDRADQAANVPSDEERTHFPVFQYNRGGDGTKHLSIHTGSAGVITNVHYTNGAFNNAKLHYNVKKSTGTAEDGSARTGRSRFSVDTAQAGAAGQKEFSRQLVAMQKELIDFLVQTQIDVNAMKNIGQTDAKFKELKALADKPADWGPGRKNKKGNSITFSLSGGAPPARRL